MGVQVVSKTLTKKNKKVKLVKWDPIIVRFVENKLRT